MSAINGIGTRYTGQSEVQADGSYIATKWICVVLPLIPTGSYRIWPQTSNSYLFGMYSSATFKAVRVPLHWPHIFKFYGLYFAFYLFVVVTDRIGSGEWHFSSQAPQAALVANAEPSARPATRAKPERHESGQPAFESWARRNIRASDFRYEPSGEVWISLLKTPQDPQGSARESAAHYKRFMSSPAPVKVVLFANNEKVAEATE